MQPFMRILKSAAIGLTVLGALLFIPAGTFNYWQGWAFIAVFSISNLIIGLYLSLKDPALLARRKRVGPFAEKQFTQKIIMTSLIVIFLILPVLCALDWRFGWSHVPAWVSVLGDMLVAIGLMMNLRVFQENTFGSSTIEKMEGQKVITTGPYALVRHPMYSGILVFIAGVPLALGSYWGLLGVLLMVPILILRIFDEEEMLFQELEGYEIYARKVQYRLVPGIW